MIDSTVDKQTDLNKRSPNGRANENNPTNGLTTNETHNLIDIDCSIYETNRTCLAENSKNNIDCSSNDSEMSQMPNVVLDDSTVSNDKNHILYVLVVGFHHKKGCQIDFCYPPMKNTTPNAHENSPTNKLPSIWKTLPSIALPDGAHNYDRDTIYFHLPHPKNTQQTIYGISCYRQISTEQLKEKDEDVTRGTVQKSVVVLSELPLYGK